MPSLDIPGEFLRHAVLDTVVPHASNIDLEAALAKALEGGADDLSSVLSLIPQRSLLFFVSQMNFAPRVWFSDCPIARGRA